MIHLGYRLPQRAAFWNRLEDEIQSNVLDTVRLLAAAEDAGVGCVCFASSTSVYGTESRVVTERSSAMGETSPYAIAKLIQEQLVTRWADRAGRCAAVLRLATAYGPGEKVGRAIPNFIRRVLSGNNPVVDGLGRTPFEPIHVSDVARSFAAAASVRATGVFNVGTGIGWAPYDVAALVIKLCGARLCVDENPQTTDRGRAICDVSRAASGLGFESSVSLQEGLRGEIAWFLARQGGLA